MSDNSLKSDMVKLEWQNALIKSLSSDTKFIPVRLDRSEMPAILKQILYLDVFQMDLKLY
ncbi:TIR domain protein [Leptotrichia wadei]|uniref:TIR domain protein n=1 Tax=Leptotrichia wadei TaxID=157687 RepID=A0A510KCC7_9FUSO|nr:TIR domain protein [Leptotrichia wadei]